MKIIRSAQHLTADVRAMLSGRNVGVTIGNFDAIHLGHQTLFETLDKELSAFPEESRRRGLITFWPHPRQVLSGLSQSDIRAREEFFTVFTARDKLDVIRRAGFDFCYVIRFRRSFAALSPEQFVLEHLVEPFAPKVVVVGDDWSFGKGRAGNADKLRELGAKHGFRVVVVAGVEQDGKRVSTSGVKTAIRAADFPLLRRLLGRSYALSGRVVPGEKRGRGLGFPTANLEFQGLLLPPDGIYAAWVNVAGGRVPAAVYIGVRPTYGPGRRVVEAHLLAEPPGGFHLYRKRLEVVFDKHIRSDKHFASEDELRTAIAADIAAVRQHLSTG